MLRRMISTTALLAACVPWPSNARASEPVSFQREVMAILSKAGCNAGACHGNFNGKNGFRLSLRGQDPAFDHAALTRDQYGRRLDRQRPEASLLLLKPTGAVPHEGGVLLTRGGVEYEMLLRWLKEGQRNDRTETPPLVKLLIEPQEAVRLGKDESVAMRVHAAFADGSTRDVTGLAAYEPLDPRLIVSRDGEVRRGAGGQGHFVDAGVLVRYLNKRQVVRLTFIDARAGVETPPPANYVDVHVHERLKILGIEPSGPCADHVFLRRAHLDLLGRPPTVEEARSFLADPSPDKRQTLVERLLQRPEFADFWALKWADLLRAEEKTLDAKGVRGFHGYLRHAIASNKPLNELAREIVAARGSTYANPAANFYRALRDDQSRTEAVAQVFLGVRLQCAKCHNHPFDEWTQDDYYGMAAFFARIQYQILENNRRDRFDLHEFDGEQVVWQGRQGEVRHPQTGKAVPPSAFGWQPPTPRDGDRLQVLADWLADPGNPFFARAQANRIWHHLMGRGIVDPIDDFRLSNLPSNPALLEALAGDLAASGFDLRGLIRTIMASRTYQAAARPTPTNAADEARFARAQVRRLQAEQLLDAMSQALEVPLKLRGYPEGTRASQLAGAAAPPRRQRRDAAASAGELEIETFLRAFGKPDRLLTCECERSDEPTMIQAFRFIAGDPARGMLETPNNRLGRLLQAGKTTGEILEELYLAALSRFPTADERGALTAYVEKAGDRRAAFEDVAWGLLNSKEFLLRQ